MIIEVQYFDLLDELITRDAEEDKIKILLATLFTGFIDFSK